MSPEIPYVDLIIIFTILIITITSFFKGFINESLSLFSWVLAGWFTIEKLQIVTLVLNNKYSVPSQLQIPLAITGLMILSLIILSVITILIRGLLYKLGVSSSDRLLGLFVGLIKSILMVSFILTLLNMSGLSNYYEIRSSPMASIFSPITIFMEKELYILQGKIS